MAALRFHGPVLPDGETQELYVVDGRITYEAQAGAETAAEGWIVMRTTPRSPGFSPSETFSHPYTRTRQGSRTTKESAYKSQERTSTHCLT